MGRKAKPILRLQLVARVDGDKVRGHRWYFEEAARFSGRSN